LLRRSHGIQRVRCTAGAGSAPGSILEQAPVARGARSLSVPTRPQGPPVTAGAGNAHATPAGAFTAKAKAGWVRGNAGTLAQEPSARLRMKPERAAGPGGVVRLLRPAPMTPTKPAPCADYHLGQSSGYRPVAISSLLTGCAARYLACCQVNRRLCRAPSDVRTWMNTGPNGFSQ
jgi:hypothetical protein